MDLRRRAAHRVGRGHHDSRRSPRPAGPGLPSGRTHRPGRRARPLPRGWLDPRWPRCGRRRLPVACAPRRHRRDLGALPAGPGEPVPGRPRRRARRLHPGGDPRRGVRAGPGPHRRQRRERGRQPGRRHRPGDGSCRSPRAIADYDHDSNSDSGATGPLPAGHGSVDQAGVVPAVRRGVHHDRSRHGPLPAVLPGRPRFGHRSARLPAAGRRPVRGRTGLHLDRRIRRPA